MWLVVSVTACLLASSVFVNYKLFRSLIRVEDQLEESLDVLDDCYSRLYRAAQTPVASDDPIVKDVLQSILESRDALLLIANKITKND